MNRVEAQDLRTEVYDLLRRWEQHGKLEFLSHQEQGQLHYNRTARHLCWLFNRLLRYEKEPMNDKEIADCQKLLGPHGYTYYRVMVTQRENIR